MKKAAQIVLKFILSVIFLLVFFLVSGVALFWTHPDFVINEKSFKSLLSLMKPDLEASWNQFHVTFSSVNWASKHVHLETEHLCVRWKSTVNTCIDELRLDLTFSVENFKFQLTDFKELRAQVPFVVLSLPPAAKSETEDKMPNLEIPKFETILPPSVDFKLIREISLNLTSFEFRRGEAIVMHGRLFLEKQKLESQGLALNLKAKVSESGGWELQSESEWRISEEKNRLEMQGNVRFLQKTLNLRTPLHLVWQEQLSLKALPEIKTKGVYLKTPLDLVAHDHEWRMKLESFRLNRLWSRADFEVRDVQALLLTNLDSNHFTLSCDVRVTPRNWKEKLGSPLVHLSSQAQLTNEKMQEVRAQITIGAQGHHPLLDGKIDLKSEFVFNLSDYSFKSSPTLVASSNLRIQSYELWVNLFKGTALAIPAPLSTLKGAIALDIDTEETSAKESRWRIALSTMLKDFRQRLLTVSKANVHVLGSVVKPDSVDLDLDVNLKEIILVAPPMQLTGMPQVIPDRRFIREAQVAPKKLPFSLNWRANVHNESPILIDSNLLKSPVPLAVRLLASKAENPQGAVQVLEMPFEVFGKKAKVDHLKINYIKDSRLSGVDGLVVYQTPEVKIEIQLLGTTERPRIEFQSDPPLSRQQILSVLLFNKSLDELTEEEIDTAGNMSKAFSDGAFGLFSLVFLSSTPIQSVNYDPTTATYSARLKVDDKTTLAMSSDFEQSRQFTLRHRLGGRWAIRTELREQEQEADVVVTLLEWFRRY